MKKILIVFLLTITLSLSGTTYYVSTSGNDTNPGTIDRPFATWQKGFAVAVAGDIVYIRGGTYYASGVNGLGTSCGVYINGKNGTSSDPINIWAYPGETPVLDCRNITQAGSRMGIYLYDADYWYLKGLSVTRMDQHSSGSYISSGVRIYSGNYNKLEHITSYANGGSGISVVYSSEGNYLLNCDAYCNYDKYTSGDNADGIEVSFIVERNGNERVNTLRGCRSWDNSDDGFDHYRCEGILIIDKCWAWHNGVIPGTETRIGDGNGFKLGGTFGTPESVAQRTVTNSIACDHVQNGFSQQSAQTKMIFYNNTSYDNGGYGFEFVDYNMADILRNNISYGDNATATSKSSQTSDHNSWQGGIQLTNEDFVSLDKSQLAGSRKGDGSLPDITFLHPAAGSDLIDAGTDVGLSYMGNAPDLGAFETESGSTTNSKPLYVSSVIENASPSVIEMTYNLTLANIVPPASAFSVKVSSAAMNVTSVSVSGTKVLLTLASSVAYSNTVTVSYTVPTSNPLQTPTGGEADAIDAKSVTNKINAPPGPVYVSSAIENSTPSVLEITYSLTLANIVPPTSAFSVQVNSATSSVTSVTVSGTKVLLTLGSSVAYGNDITVSYTVPSSNPLQTANGGKAVSISAKSVTNKINAPPSPIPAYFSSVIENATPSLIEITYSLALANIVPAASAFLVNVNSAARSVSSVSISGTKVFLTLTSPVVYGNTVTVAYTKPSANPLQTTSGGQAATISAQTVKNNVNAVSQPVVVVTPPAVVNSPPVVVVNNISGTYSGFVGTLNASGSYDANKDNLIYTWKAPGDIPLSATNSSVIEFLAPIVDANQTFQFTLTVSDGKSPQTKTVPVTIIPYEPELEKAEVTGVEASNFQTTYYPSNIIDGNIGTMWSANGYDQWIVLELDGTYTIQHIQLAFQTGQKKEFYFDVFGSNDKENWEPILSKSNSCAFSGNLQVFNFPASKTEKEFRYVKLVGQGNSVDQWNYVSEFRIFGYRHKNPVDYEDQIVKIYPNPAHNLVNILIDEPTFTPDFIKIVSLTGKILFGGKVDPGSKQLQIPIDFKQGIYIVQMGTGNLTVFTQKLIVSN